MTDQAAAITATQSLEPPIRAAVAVCEAQRLSSGVLNPRHWALYFDGHFIGETSDPKKAEVFKEMAWRLNRV